MTYVMPNVAVIVIPCSTIKQRVTVVKALWRLRRNHRRVPIIIFAAFMYHLGMKGRLTPLCAETNPTVISETMLEMQWTHKELNNSHTKVIFMTSPGYAKWLIILTYVFGMLLMAYKTTFVCPIASPNMEEDENYKSVCSNVPEYLTGMP